MAKRKTPKAEKVIDLTPKSEAITEEQLNRLQRTVKAMDHLTMDVGRMEIKKSNLIRAMESVQTDVDNLRNEFRKDYGTDNVNIQNGSIEYPPEASNPKDNGETDKKD